MEPEVQKKTDELLTNWSKWLITLNFFSGAGCVVALKTAGPGVERTGIFFFLAIVCFSFSCLVGTALVLLLALKNLHPEKKTANLIWLAVAQWALFLIAFVPVLIWIALLSKTW